MGRSVSVPWILVETFFVTLGTPSLIIRLMILVVEIAVPTRTVIVLGATEFCRCGKFLTVFDPKNPDHLENCRNLFRHCVC